MNVAFSLLNAVGIKGAGTHAPKTGPLADFMAMFEKLGVTVEKDDATGALKLDGLPAGSEDAANKLLAQLTSTTNDAAGKDADEDPAKALTALLDKISDDLGDPKSPAKEQSDAPKGDIASLLSLVGALIAKEPAAQAETAGAKPDTSPVAASATKGMAKTAAAMLAPLKDIAQSDQDETPSNEPIQTTFARLAALIQGNSSESEKPQGDAIPATVPRGVSEEPAVPDEKITPITELLARLGLPTPDKKTALVAPTTPTPSAPPPQPTTLANSPQIAQSMGTRPQPVREERKTAEHGHTVSTIDGLTATLTPALNATGQLQPMNNASDAVSAPPSADTGQQTSEILVQHHLDLAKDSQWLDMLARDISRAAQNESQLRFQLNPEHLGSLKVEVVNGAQGTSVKLTADTESARAILADAQPKLIAEARAQGLRISEAQVNLSSQGQGQQRQTPDPMVIVRASNAGNLVEVEQAKSTVASERYA